MRTTIEHAKRRQRGAASVEYALLLVMVALVLVGVMTSVETSVGAFWSNVASQISSVVNAGQ
ncbi:MULTISPECIES: Flp family type IVb pilin [Ralstonia solanacearum species complex]|uniref:Pilin protein n=2 Tax=Ralstonia solanacearum TaxID=305 RepID=A0ABF7RF82_RALSL|nr:Flp family type IVb pilin [Ralstonia solanacearum]ALF87254.1 Flp/Fap pilin component [Ralstonia solanacearum]ATI26793.1 Flp family type IVb pilin [Ralstonia solanacearum]AYB52344.2 Flp family type IVb pilin [Ralstonia solanacearum]AYB56903.1 Flp family type IVb pilin [Ralstonia solanacearum]KEI31873.1 pili assembly chaperone [Ralstonia solanacearum]